MGIYWKLIWAYLKIGIFGFGGGYAMLSLVERIVVSDNAWISEQMFTDVYDVSGPHSYQQVAVHTIF